MQQVTFSYEGEEFSIPHFRTESGQQFEPFNSYIVRHLPEIILTSIPQIVTYRCAVSGYPVGLVNLDELTDMLIHATTVLQFDDLQAEWGDVSQNVVRDAIESIIDHLAIRMLQIARPGPSLSYSNGRFAIAALSKQKQLAILANQLLFDGGNYRGSYSGLEDLVDRIRKSVAMADQIAANWDEHESLHELHSALVELDAKYRIQSLVFSRREHDELIAFREGEGLQPVELTAYVLKLIDRRDADGTLEPYPQRWSQQVYRSVTFEAAERLNKSNLVTPEAPLNREARQPKAKEPTTPEGRFKAAKKAKLNSLLGSLFQ